jgi:hypothetical protein
MNCNVYSVFHEIGQAKFAYGGSILSSSQFLQLRQLPQILTHNIKRAKMTHK